ncbi:MAG: hypothetical protein C0423_08590 [Methylibium sp.]|nr:hypothetical protein [Methylibium sp.]
MPNLRNGLAYRLAWSSFAALLCWSYLSAAIKGADWGHAIAALAWALFGVSLFLRPLVPSTSLSDALRRTAATSVGAPALRNGLSFAALALLAVGLVLRLTSGA